MSVSMCPGSHAGFWVVTLARIRKLAVTGQNPTQVRKYEKVGDRE